MPTTLSARDAAELEPLCDDCVAHEGLCAAHRPHVVPQLKQPSWYRDVHRGEHHVAEKLSPEGEKVRRRKAKKAAARLSRALAGEFTRSRPQAA